MTRPIYRSSNKDGLLGSYGPYREDKSAEPFAGVVKLTEQETGFCVIVGEIIKVGQGIRFGGTMDTGKFTGSTALKVGRYLDQSK